MMKHCLVVDDSDIVRKVARAFLERLGYMVIEAQDGDEAIQRCEQAMPDMILIDWHMPGRPPIETISALKRINGQTTPVIIYMTTENDERDIAQARSAGAHDVLLKPFDRYHFDGKINMYAH